MVTLLLAGLAHAAGPDFSLETRYASAFGPDAWATAHLRAEATDGLDVGVFLLGGTRSAALASARQAVGDPDRAVWRGELLFGLRRTAVDQPGGPTVGATSDLTVVAADPVALFAGGGVLPGVGGWFEGGVDAHATGRLTLHPRLRAGTWAGDRDLALRAELGASLTDRRGWFLRASVGAGGRDTVHLGPSATLAFGRSS